MGWQKRFKVVGVVPGKIFTRQFGELDLSNPNIPVEKIERLVADGCRFVELIPDESKPNKSKKDPE